MSRFVNVLVIAVMTVAVGSGCGGQKTPPDMDVDTPPADVVQDTPIETPPMEQPAETPPPPLLLEDIYFDFDKAEIRGDARRTLDANASQLMVHDDERIVIEGHCDERGTPDYNLALGQRRAQATMQYLIGKGIDAARLSTVSYGEERPVDPRHTEDAWSKNRRSHFRVQG